ncbi:hypothetical protein LTR94_033152, partial [Friedmanniomyces endolithicus]
LSAARDPVPAEDGVRDPGERVVPGCAGGGGRGAGAIAHAGGHRLVRPRPAGTAGGGAPPRARGTWADAVAV